MGRPSRFNANTSTSVRPTPTSHDHEIAHKRSARMPRPRANRRRHSITNRVSFFNATAVGHTGRSSGTLGRPLALAGYDWFKEREDGMETLSDTLTKRVEGLIESHHHEKLLTTTGTRTLVCELLERNEGLELV